MKLFFAYLSQHKRSLLLFACFTAIFLIVFFLSGIALDAVFYACLLCAVPALAALTAGFIRFTLKHKQMLKMLASSDISLDGLPEPANAAERDWHALVEHLFEAKSAASRQEADRRESMRRYYTLWAHQIKTPIAAMRLLLDDTPHDSEIAQQLFKTEQYVDMVLQYIRKDQSDYCFSRVSVRETASSSVKKYSLMFIRKKIELDFCLPEFAALTDPKWLAFVLEQLLSNAIKYTPSGGRITVGGNAERQEIFISDTGIGIPPQDIGRVCELGYTGLSGRTYDRSTGIGLYLCKEVCKNLSCPMDIRSVCGKGTTVTLRLCKQDTAIEM